MIKQHKNIKKDWFITFKEVIGESIKICIEIFHKTPFTSSSLINKRMFG